MYDAGIRRHDREVAKARLSPAQKRVAFFIALEFKQRVHIEGAGRSEFVHLHRVVDDQFGGLQRVDKPGVAAHALHGIAHGGKIDNRRHAGKILQQHSAWREGDFLFWLRTLIPRRQRADFSLRHVTPVFGAQQVLQQDAQRKRQVPGGDALLVQSVEPVKFVFFVADFESCAGTKTIR